MKKSLILVGMLSIGYAYAQEGNVGINTETPESTLHVKSKTGVDETTKALEIENANAKKMFTILDNGNVGIGTESPMVNLHIEGDKGQNSELMLTRFVDNSNGANLTFMKARGSSANPIAPNVGDALVRFRSGGYSGIIGKHNQVNNGYDGFSSQIVTTVAGTPNENGTLPSNMTFLVTNKEGGRNTLLKLQSDSGVGIAFAETEDIKARLHINDWNDVTLSSTKNALLIGRENSVNLVMDANEIMVRNNGAPSGLSLQAQGGDLFVNTENADVTKRFYFRSNTGNLGLGVATPTEKLDVNGNVKAQSFLGANGATIFPDYVFQKYYTGTSSIKSDYSFKTLSQVEDFVKTNGHLPGYKSAETIKAQGYVDLMETQLTNVEKIEELYLHLMEKDKEVQDLKQRLERLEKLIK